MRWLTLLTLAGCLGGLGDAPLTLGEISGHLVGSEAGGARVFLLSQPSFSGEADAQGNFTITGIPAGEYQLVAIARTTALRASATVEPGAISSPASLALMAGSSLAAAVRINGIGVAGVTVNLEGTPVSAETDSQGVAQLGVVPSGCFEVSAQVERSALRQSVCAVAPNPGFASLELGTVPDGGVADGGACPESCPNGQVCDSREGQCYLCAGKQGCPPEAICLNHACLQQPASCQPCNPAGPMCGLGSICSSPADGGAGQCLSTCAGDDDCRGAVGYGYHCDGSQCILNGDEIAACAATAALGQACTRDDDCVQAGLLEGVCVSISGLSVCSVGCEITLENLDCPPNWRCEASDGGAGVCHP